MIVTPGPTSRPRDVAAIVRFWRALGGRVTRQSPDVHDAAVAAISHLPHVVASVLAAATPPEHLPLVAGGWRDTTRVAAGAPDLWRQIMLDNRNQILDSLERFSVLLSEFRAALDAGNVQSLLRLLEKGKTIRDAVGN